VEAYCCPCPANKLRVSSLRWPPQDEQPKKAQGEKKTKKLKTKVDGACQKCRQTAGKRVFPSTLKFQTSHHLDCQKKISNHLTNKHEQTNVREKKKKSRQQNLSTHMSTRSRPTASKKKKKKEEKSRKNR
jgi:hypothetical protein